MFQDFSHVIFQSPVCVLLMALVFALSSLGYYRKTMFYTRAFLSSTLSPSLFALNFKLAFTLSFSCKSPPEWIFSHLFNQALLACSQTMNKHISTQINAAKQARNEETRRRNMRVHNCQRSRFGFVAGQLCGHHRNIYGPIEI